MSTPDQSHVATHRQLLQEHGLRVTLVRVAVLHALERAAGHLSVEEIARDVITPYPSISMVTLYRTLDTLEAHGLVFSTRLGDRVVRWERARQAHHHIVCRRCGAVVEVGPAPFEHLAATLAATYGVQVDVRHLALPGVCAHCLPSVA